jgi:hypothetical protein
MFHISGAGRNMSMSQERATTPKIQKQAGKHSLCVWNSENTEICNSMSPVRVRVVAKSEWNMSPKAIEFLGIGQTAKHRLTWNHALEMFCAASFRTGSISPVSHLSSYSEDGTELSVYTFMLAHIWYMSGKRGVSMALLPSSSMARLSASVPVSYSELDTSEPVSVLSSPSESLFLLLE